MRNSGRRVRWLAVCVGIVIGVAATVGSLFAHAVVFPAISRPGAYEKYVLRVPNERPVPTVRVEITFPAEVKVVSFAEVPGWMLEVRRDSAGAVTGAVWTGEIGVERFVEFPFVAVNPAEEARLTWRAVQVYSNGERVSWSGAEGSETPASFTMVQEPESVGSKLPIVLSAIALLLALGSLGFALRRQGTVAG
jgi:uncharacterized protein YcnI